uniref:G-protein coupled receptors family 1 profile domain-containing protein n=1 Tax=Plectus sambesii TaxID=2011161 RepID=A0A914VS67_9BILA
MRVISDDRTWAVFGFVSCAWTERAAFHRIDERNVASTTALCRAVITFYDLPPNAAARDSLFSLADLRLTAPDQLSKPMSGGVGRRSRRVSESSPPVGMICAPGPLALPCSGGRCLPRPIRRPSSAHFRALSVFYLIAPIVLFPRPWCRLGFFGPGTDCTDCFLQPTFMENARADGNQSTMGDHGSAVQLRHPMLAVLLGSFCVVTVFGNCLVVVAVAMKKYLHNPTGYLIVSLAFADLIVGTIVMPFNIVYEMSHHDWPFGLTVCDIFHSVDILASTASIWNLCVISLDRYIANRNPISYRDIVTTRRIIIAIATVWLVSALLSFPAIIYWRRSSPHLYSDQRVCQFTDSLFYVLFSSFVSFYLPLSLILFAYGRVFLIATRHTKSLRTGHKQVKRSKRTKMESDSVDSSLDPGSMLRVHWGRAKSSCAASSATSSVRSSVVKANQVDGSLIVHSNGKHMRKQVSSRSLILEGNTVQRTITGSNELQSKLAEKMLTPNVKHTVKSASVQRFIRHGSENSFGNSPRPSVVRQASVLSNSDRTNSQITVLEPVDVNDEWSRNRSPSMNSGAWRRLGLARRKQTMKERSRHLVKYVQEQRAARTLGIVVGAFVACWAPFFIFHILVVACDDCFANKDLVFTVLTWLGHVNSMLNPLIYSRFSREFRRAFTQILTCTNDQRMNPAMNSPFNLVFAQLMSITHVRNETPNLELSRSKEELA